MTEDKQKDIGFYRRAVKNDGMAIAWDVFVVCGKEVILAAMKHIKGFRFPDSTWKNDGEIDSRSIHLYVEKTFHTSWDC